MVSAAGVAQTEGPTLAVQFLIGADLAVFCPSDEGHDTGCITEEHQNRQNEKGPGHCGK
jgi:hypothetical protein